MKHIYQIVKNTANQIESEFVPLLEIVSSISPRNFMEIGTDRGGTFLAFEKISQPDGIRISLDIPRAGFWGFDFAKLKSEMIERGNILVHADSHSQTAFQAVKTALSLEKLDFLFIDGDHSYDGVKQDYEMYEQFVRTGGIIAFHDIKDTEKHRSQGCFVSQFWRSLDVDGKIELCSSDNWGGIGVMRKTTTSRLCAP